MGGKQLNLNMETVSSTESLMRDTILYGVISQRTDILKILNFYFVLRGKRLVF